VFELLHYKPVSLAIADKFRSPERPVSFWCRRFRATLVPMPKTAMHKDGPTVAPVGEIRRPWETFAPHPVPATESRNDLAYR